MMIRSAAVLCMAILSAQSLTPDLGRLNDAETWRLIDADARVDGPVVHLTPHGNPAVGSNIGLALAQNVKFSEGTLEIDLRGSGRQAASFLGLAFGVTDARTFEAVYFRPFRFADADPDARGHAVQYVTRQKVSVTIDGSSQPCLVVDRLGHREGDVGLWVDSMPGAFRNLRIQPAK